MKKRAVIWILFLVVVIPPVSSAAMDKAAVIGRVSGLQMPFIENRGQIWDDSVRFYAKTFAGTVYVTERGEIVYSIVKTKPAAKNSIYGHIASGRRIKSSTSRAVALRERPVGSEKTGTEGGTVSPQTTVKLILSPHFMPAELVPEGREYPPRVGGVSFRFLTEFK